VSPTLDYYAVLQVQPDAEDEVIQAAYRQLMRKYHPDRAGTDARKAAELHERAKLINEAHAVLSDPLSRRQYDTLRRPAPMSPSSVAAPATAQTARVSGGVSEAGTPAASGRTTPVPDELLGALIAQRWSDQDATPASVPRMFVATLAGIYTLLPGAYEWDSASGAEFVAVCWLPVVGTLAWALASGRLNWLLVGRPNAAVVGWAILALLALPAWRVLPRAVLGGALTVMLASGFLDNVLRATQTPIWAVWMAAGLLGLVIAPRAYVFAVLPTLGGCWLLSRLLWSQ